MLLCNLLVSREPINGVGEWAARYAPDRFDLFAADVALLHDDRLGRSLHTMFGACGPEFLLAVTRQCVREFDVSPDERHNDSTTESFHGAYAAAAESKQIGRPTAAITWGHSKARRPDLKQLPDTLTISSDGDFPLVANERKLRPLEVLRVYRRQPLIEKRFAQLKTDFDVAPVFLKDVTRIQGLLAMYFLALLAQALLERELRRRMKNRRIPTFPIYPEERNCRRPSARRVFDLFEPVLRHYVTLPNGETQIVVTGRRKVPDCLTNGTADGTSCGAVVMPKDATQSLATLDASSDGTDFRAGGNDSTSGNAIPGIVEGQMSNDCRADTRRFSGIANRCPSIAKEEASPTEPLPSLFTPPAPPGTVPTPPPVHAAPARRVPGSGLTSGPPLSSSLRRRVTPRCGVV